MKVGCQQCGASYSVADDKVAGRKLKLRCKKCGEPMIIDGTGDESGDSEPFGPSFQVVRARPSTAPSAVSEPDWYVALDDNAQGPYTLDDVLAYYAAGRVVDETLVFRDGLEGWKQARDVVELQQARSQRRTAPPPPPPPTEATPAYARASLAAAAPTDRNVAMGSDPFGDPARASSPRVSAEEMLSAGPQRDGTVQFSLEAIRALSAVTAPSVAPVAPARPGYAAGGDSGLIDMRALSEGGPGASDAFRAIGQLQASPLDTLAPMALPRDARGGDADFRTKVFAGLTAFGFLLAGGVAALAVTHTPRAVTQPSAAAAGVAQAAAQATAMGVPQVSAAMAARPEVQPEAQPARAPEPPKAQAAGDDERDAAGSATDVREERAGKPRRRGVRGAESAQREPARDEGVVEKTSRGSDIDELLAKGPAEEKPKAKGGDSSIDDLLLGALNGKKTADKAEPAPEPESSLPKTPSREQMLSALGNAKTKASKCKGPGVATAAITIAGPTGRVSNVSVAGVEGSAKSCVEKAVRSTSFPKFQKESFAVNFPFKLGA